MDDITIDTQPNVEVIQFVWSHNLIKCNEDVVPLWVGGLM